MSYRPAFDSKYPTEQRPIVILNGWLVAKSRHIYKYGDFYLGKGFDVLHTKIKPQQLVWPPKTHNLVRKTLDFLQEPPRNNQPILVHGFSVGCYLFGEMLTRIVKEPEKYGDVGKRIIGQIFDSPVDLKGIPKGTSKAMFSSPPLQKSLEKMLEMYLQVFKENTLKHYLEAETVFLSNHLRTPTLILHSTADKIAIPGPILNMKRKFEAKGIEVYTKCWDDSKHVSHFHKHPVEYIQTLNMFLGKIGLSDVDSLRGQSAV